MANCDWWNDLWLFFYHDYWRISHPVVSVTVKPKTTIYLFHYFTLVSTLASLQKKQVNSCFWFHCYWNKIVIQLVVISPIVSPPFGENKLWSLICPLAWNKLLSLFYQLWLLFYPGLNCIKPTVIIVLSDWMKQSVIIGQDVNPLVNISIHTLLSKQIN